jgi:AraC-like DNA-binding protein
VARRSTHLRAGGLYEFEDTLTVETTISATFVTCAAWLLELYELDGGDIYFLSGASEVRSPSRRFAVIFPPFSIARVRLEGARGRVFGYADTSSLPARFAGNAALFQTRARAGTALPLDLLECATAVESIPAWPHASAVSRRAKAIVDQSYLARVSFAQIAARLGITTAHLSRQFKRDFQMTPTAYLHQLRLADAPLKLARGEEIAAVSHDVGYGDLSRFYKQFRKVTRTSPGVCREMIAPAGRDSRAR